MSDESNISGNIFESFDDTSYSLWMLNFNEIYDKIFDSLPPRNISFLDLSLERSVGCEVICAAICHQINWDFLREAVYKMTKKDDTWIIPEKLSKITSEQIIELLGEYGKPERIRERERCSLLRSLGNSLLEMKISYLDLFFSHNLTIKSEREIMEGINSIKAFSSDPEGKKAQLLLQNLSEYKPLSALSNYCKPAIDYHIIREFLRRGLVAPTNKQACEFILRPEIERQERTIAGLRKVCSEVFYTLQWLTSYDITTLNTIEWWIGRSVCLKKAPDCYLEGKASQWLKRTFDKCPFYDSCYAMQFDNSFLKVVEPNYQGNSY